MAHRTSYHKITHQRSFTLLETIVAIYVLLAGIVGAMNLTQQNISAITLFRHQLIAANLAQEGAELVRNKRDSNAIACFKTARTTSSCFDFSAPPTDPKSNPNTENMKGIAGVLSGGTRCDDPDWGCRVEDPFADPISFVQCDSAASCKYLQLDASGKYQYNSGTQTIFDRRITVTEVTGAGTGRDAGLKDWRVVSTVTWYEKANRKEVRVEGVLTPHMPQH